MGPIPGPFDSSSSASRPWSRRLGGRSKRWSRARPRPGLSSSGRPRAGRATAGRRCLAGWCCRRPARSSSRAPASSGAARGAVELVEDAVGPAVDDPQVIDVGRVECDPRRAGAGAGDRRAHASNPEARIRQFARLAGWKEIALLGYWRTRIPGSSMTRMNGRDPRETAGARRPRSDLGIHRWGSEHPGPVHLGRRRPAVLG
jgi:hypothetical protein